MLRNLLVHLDSSPRTAVRLQLAINLAREHGARLTGLFAQRASAHRVGIVATWPTEQYTAAADASKAQFATAISGLANATWIDLNRGGEQQILQLATEYARHFDLVITGQEEEGDARQVPHGMVDQIILESGRPVLVIPYIGDYAELGRRPLIAWNESRAASRALNDALLLLRTDCEAHLVTMSPPGAPTLPTTDLTLQQLASHGISARKDSIQVDDIGVMDMLLNRAADVGADLLVAGAFGGYGFPMMSRGSGTRFLLRHMTLPVLFSH